MGPGKIMGASMLSVWAYWATRSHGLHGWRFPACNLSLANHSRWALLTPLADIKPTGIELWPLESIAICFLSRLLPHSEIITSKLRNNRISLLSRTVEPQLMALLIKIKIPATTDTLLASSMYLLTHYPLQALFQCLVSSLFHTHSRSFALAGHTIQILFLKYL